MNDLSINDLDKIDSGFSIKDKLRAFLIHAGMSLPVFGVLFLLVRLVWYPDFYYGTQAIQAFLFVVFLVDVVLGPLLTFVVYKKNKPSLKLDLGLIILFQLAVFIYGLSIVYKERPLYLVYTLHYFIVVPADAIDEDAVRFSELKSDLPRIVGTSHPATQKEKSELLSRVMAGGADIHHLPHLYRPIADVRDAMDEKGVSVEKLPEVIINEIWDRWPNKTGSDLRVYPFVPEKTGDQLLVWDVENQKMLGLVDVNPWPIIKAANRVN